MNKAPLLTALLCLSLLASCGKASADTAKAVASRSADVAVVTFIELGSVNCVPCRAMQPVMDQVRATYGSQVNVLFYDVWTPEGRPYGQQYGIRAIPTQVFLDKDGKEYFRHEGYFAYERLVEALVQGGLKR